MGEKVNGEGFIKIFRSLANWEWYTDANTTRVFLHCLLKANWKDGRFRGNVVPAGTFITSYGTMAEELQISVKSVRTAFEHLESSGEIVRQTASKWQAVTVVNWAKFQLEENTNGRQDGTLTAGKRQANGRQRATIEEYKNIRNKESKNNNEASSVLDLLSNDEYDSLTLLIGSGNLVQLVDEIDECEKYKSISNGYKYLLACAKRKGMVQ